MLRVPNYYRLFSFLLLALLALGTSGVRAQVGPGYQSYKQGMRSFKQGDYQSALSGFDQAISKESNNYKYYYAKGMAYIKLNQFKGAISPLEKAVQVNPGWTKGYIMLAKLAMKQKDLSSTVRYLNQAYSNENDREKKLKYKIYVVKILLKMEKPQQAMSELQKAKQISPKDLQVLSTEGDVQLALKNYAAAERAYAESLQLLEGSPKEKKVKYMAKRAVAMHESGSKSQADEYAKGNLSGKYMNYYKAKTRGGSLQAQKDVRLANSYLKADLYDEALKYVNQAMKGDENPGAQVYVRAGMIYYKRDQLQQAISSFEKAAAATDKEEMKMKLYNYMLKLQMKARQYGGAVQTTNKILQQDPKNVKVLLMRSKAQYNNGEYNGALKSVQQALQVSKGSESAKAQLYFQYGISAKKAGRLDEAKKAFKKAASNGALKYAAINEMKTMEQ